MTARILWHESVSCSKVQDAMPLVRELLHSKLQTEMYNRPLIGLLIEVGNYFLLFIYLLYCIFYCA